MRNYKIYLFEEEFATHYFGRESMLYNLFLEHNRSSYNKKDLIEKQIKFITRPIPSFRIHQAIEIALKNYHSYRTFSSSHILKFQIPKSAAKISVYDRHIELQSEGTIEAETIFFEILRKYDSCFLAMDYERDRYGWLNPIKERKFV